MIETIDQNDLETFFVIQLPGQLQSPKSSACNNNFHGAKVIYSRINLTASFLCAGVFSGFLDIQFQAEYFGKLAQEQKKANCCDREHDRPVGVQKNPQRLHGVCCGNM